MTNAFKQLRYILVCSFGIAILAVSMQPLAAGAAPLEDAGGPAGSNCSQAFLTFPAWYRGLLDSDCSIKSPTETGGVVRFVTTILLNVVECILQASGYASVIFIIYGGYKYMISAGSPDGMVGARKTIVNAVIGLVISLGAAAIVNTIARGL